MMMHGWSGSMSGWDWMRMLTVLVAVSAVGAAGIALAVRPPRAADRR